MLPIAWLSPDGQWLVTGSADGTARVWDVINGRELRALRGEKTGPVWAVAVTLEGKRVVTGNEDGTARVWDSATGQQLLTFKHQTGRVWAVAATPDGRIVTGSGDGTARIWDVRSGRELLPALNHAADAAAGRPTPEVTSVAISANGQWLITRDAQWRVKVWDGRTGREFLSLHINRTGQIRCVALTPDGKQLAVGTQHGMAKLLDMPSGQPILSVMGHTPWVMSVAVSPDGTRLATASLDGTAQVWDTAGRQGTVTLKGHTGPVRSVAVSADGKRMVTGCEDGTAWIWDARTGNKLLAIEGHTAAVSRVAVSPDGQRMVTGCEEGPRARSSRGWSPASRLSTLLKPASSKSLACRYLAGEAEDDRHWDGGAAIPASLFGLSSEAVLSRHEIILHAGRVPLAMLLGHLIR